MGVAAATLMPSALALISTMFHDPVQRGRAIAVWAGCFMGGTALGPVVGGMLLEYFWWGSVFLIGVPVMAVVLVLAPIVLPEYRDPGASGVDPPSVLLSVAALLSIMFGLKELARHGLEPVPVLALAAGLVVGAVLLRRQRVLGDPLLDLTLFRAPAFTAALVIMMVSMLGTGGGYLFITGFLQMVEGLSPMQAGLWMVPSALVSVLAAQLAPVLAGRLGHSTVIGGALIVGTIGWILLAFVPASGGFALLISGFIIVFIGVGTFGALGTTLVVGSAPRERGGSAAALSTISGDLGVALGIALLGSLGAGIYRATVTTPADVPSGVAAAVGASMEDTIVAVQGLPPQQAGEVLVLAEQAFTNGLNAIGITCAVLTAISATVALTLLRRPSSHDG